MKIIHINDGNCKKCDEIFDHYPNFHIALRRWFKAFQMNHSEAHISCAGRGQHDQERCFTDGSSDAAWGHSAHNYNCAIDLWVNRPIENQIPQKWMYPEAWFLAVLAPELPVWLTWYGVHGSPYYELPHVELSHWRQYRDEGLVKLVE